MNVCPSCRTISTIFNYHDTDKDKTRRRKNDRFKKMERILKHKRMIILSKKRKSYLRKGNYWCFKIKKNLMYIYKHRKFKLLDLFVLQYKECFDATKNIEKEFYQILNQKLRNKNDTDNI
jgi:hypothetical protein